MSGITKLIDGYRRFRETGWARQRERWSELAEGQSPKTMVIACSDSRVDPSQIFDAGPGEIFVVRNVAALVPPYETAPGHHGVSAALEFAVTQLQVEEVLVLGHGACGGCAAALTGQFDEAAHGEGHFIADWIEMLREARDKVRAEAGEDFRAMELEAVRVSLANLRTFPWVRERELDGRLRLRGAYFAIAEGILYLLDRRSGEFSPA
ncbi:MAG TPA: carbonic anhydrase [Allosphingosinicella sp.]|nr:carbonic anhydrase [Allosphingosinicella sp.]